MMHIPVTTSLKGKGAISEQSAYSLGSLGVTSYGNAYQYISEKSDLLIFLGAGFNERTSYLWDESLMDNKKIAQVDIDEAQLEKVFKADVTIHGDVKEVVAKVLARIKANGKPVKKHNNIASTIEALRADKTEQDADVFEARFPLVANFYRRLEQAFPSGIQIFDDNIIFAQNFFNVAHGNLYYPNSGVSSLGNAIPAAIGASFAESRPTFAILGDGGFQMCCMEIMTAVNYDIPLNIVMFNNSTMGLIRKNQSQQYEARYINCDFINPDYELLAQSFGIQYHRIDSDTDLYAVFKNTDFHRDTNLIEIMIDKNTFPNYVTRR